MTARQVMQEVRSAPFAGALATVLALASRLAAEREEALSARSALLAIRLEELTDTEPDEADSMSITELAEALGVKASKLRFWEQVGLVLPHRVPTAAGAARRYRLPAIREARITAALRGAGYRIPEVRRAVTAVRELREVGASLEALETRLDEIANRTLAFLRAGATLATVIDRIRGAGGA